MGILRYLEHAQNFVKDSTELSLYSVARYVKYFLNFKPSSNCFTIGQIMASRK